MAINNDAFATKFTGELDKIITEKSSVGFMTDNAFRAKFVGAKTVKIPSISMQGLANYDRDTGFIKVRLMLQTPLLLCNRTEQELLLLTARIWTKQVLLHLQALLFLNL